MSELSFEQMFEESSFKRLRTGEAVTGQVIGVKEDEIILSIAGSKSEGIITRSEFTNEPGVDLRTKVQVGDELEAKVLKVNDGEGMAALSYKRLAADKGLKRLKEAFENKEVLKEKVTQVMEKGLVVEVEGTRVFIPASMVSDTYDKDLEDGDIVVMCSDGILDSNMEFANRDLWLKYLLEDIQTDIPERIADIILREAIDNCVGKPKDDMSVIVFKVMKK